MTRPPEAYMQSSATAIAARQLDRSGVHLRPGEMIEYIITDADSNYADDRYRALTMWEGWRGYDVAEYQRALREAFKPLEQYALEQAGQSWSLSQFPQNRLGRALEVGERTLHDLPNSLQINTEIVVNHDVPESANSTPVDSKVAGFKRIGQARGRFGQSLEVSNDGVLRLPIGKEKLLALFRKILDEPNAFQDVM
jgi:hypothetical protein